MNDYYKYLKYKKKYLLLKNQIGGDLIIENVEDCDFLDEYDKVIQHGLFNCGIYINSREPTKIIKCITGKIRSLKLYNKINEINSVKKIFPIYYNIKYCEREDKTLITMEKLDGDLTFYLYKVLIPNIISRFDDSSYKNEKNLVKFMADNRGLNIPILSKSEQYYFSIGKETYIKRLNKLLANVDSFYEEKKEIIIDRKKISDFTEGLKVVESPWIVSTIIDGEEFSFHKTMDNYYLNPENFEKQTNKFNKINEICEKFKTIDHLIIDEYKIKEIIEVIKTTMTPILNELKNKIKDLYDKLHSVIIDDKQYSYRDYKFDNFGYILKDSDIEIYIIDPESGFCELNPSPSNIERINTNIKNIKTIYGEARITTLFKKFDIGDCLTDILDPSVIKVLTQNWKI